MVLWLVGSVVGEYGNNDLLAHLPLRVGEKSHGQTFSFPV